MARTTLPGTGSCKANEAVEIFSKLEGEIGELVRRDTGASPLQQENSELAATNVGSLVQRVSDTSVQEIESYRRATDTTRYAAERGRACAT